MSKITILLGPPRDSGIFDRMRARVNAVATSPSASTCQMRNACHDVDANVNNLELCCLQIWYEPCIP